MTMTRAPSHDWALQYEMLETRLHVDAAHHPLLYRWLHIPDLRLMDALPGFAEEGLRLESGCAGHFSPSDHAILADPFEPTGSVRVTRRLRVRLTNVAYPYLFHWLSTPMAHGVRSVALVTWMECGLRVRLGQSTRPTAIVEVPVAVPEKDSLPAVAATPTPQVEQPHQVVPQDKRLNRAKLQAFAAFGTE
jgi:hypothetical protein